MLPQFESNLNALRRAYELGEIDLVSLASGRERFLEAQRDALTAQEDYFTALAELEHAVGVGQVHALEFRRGERHVEAADPERGRLQREERLLGDGRRDLAAEAGIAGRLLRDHQSAGLLDRGDDGGVIDR